VSRCPACQHENPQTARYCADCGTALDGSRADTATKLHDPAAASSAGVSAITSTPSDQGRFLPGAILAGRYRILGLLGRGGMGEVYRADDIKLGRPVALKFLPPSLEQRPDRLERFLNEARVALAVTHPNVCRVHDIGEFDGRHYISMEYIDGEDLASLLRRVGHLPQDRAVQIARQLCAGLAAAHAEGILHRDLKPANVMIDGRGRAKITDFGLAGLAGAISGGEIVAGTPAYMAPEQLTGESVSVRSDLYALGLVLYELFTGKAAFRADSVAELKQLHSHTPPSSPATHVDGLDPAVERVVLRCLGKRPESRPSSALAVAGALPGGDPLAAALAAGETPSPELLAEAGRRSALRPATAILLSLTALVFFVAATRWAGGMSLLEYLPLDKQPLIMIDQARSIIEKLGYVEPAYADPVDHAWGYLLWDDVIDEVRDAEANGYPWEALRERPDAVSFWYRQSPSLLVPQPTDGRPAFSRGYVRMLNPLPLQPGEILVLLDLAGNLRRLEVITKRFSTREPSDIDWEPLFRLAGLDPQRFTPDRARYQRYQAPDVRRAWIGSRAETPEIALRVDAGAYEGRPSLFNVATPSSLESVAVDPEPSNITWIDVTRTAVPPVTILCVVGLGLVLARRNLRQGRIDRRGAMVFAWSMGLLFATADALESHALFTAAWSAEIWPILVAGAFVGLVSWTMYAAAEPIGRQVWPTMFVSSSRLLSRGRGQWRDPLIGQSVLVGVLAGTLIFLVKGPLRMTILTLREGRQPFLLGYNFDLLLGQRQTLASMVEMLTVVAMGFLLVLALVVLRMMVKRPWLAIGLAVVVWTLIGGVESFEQFVYGLVTSSIMMVVLLRWGVVALLVAAVADRWAWSARSTDWSAWYSQPAIVALLIVTVVLLYAAWAATGDRQHAGDAIPD
jgi:serine/threonine-protein kinase